MNPEFSDWRAWTSRNELCPIAKSGVYVIGSDVERGRKPDLLDKRIIYIGRTSRGLRGRLNSFDRTCRGGRGHAGGKSFFEAQIQDHPNYDRAWEQKSHILSFAFWVPNEHWNNTFPELVNKGKLLNFVETKIQVDYVKKHKRLPKYNKSFG